MNEENKPTMIDKGEITIQIKKDENGFKYHIDIDRPTEEYASHINVRDKFAVIKWVVDELNRYKESIPAEEE